MLDIVFAAVAAQNSPLCVAVAHEALDQAAASAAIPTTLAEGARASRFAGKVAQIFESFVSDGVTAARRMLLGLGRMGEAVPSLRNAERAGGALTAKYLSSGLDSLTLDLGHAGISDDEKLAVLTGLRLRAWRYHVYRTRMADDVKPTLKAVTILGAGDAVQAAWTSRLAVIEGVELTRELVTEPANIIYPESFVERCRPLADMGIAIRVLEPEEMASLGMGALLGVAQGSVRPARMLVMEYKGEGAPDKKPLVFVGKGVTFDTGGISIKPAAGMEDMKWDMGGAAAVAGTMKALAGRKAKAHVVGICGLVENMPDGNAQRPGDVVTSMSGQTIEVINTDAEGRLVLCDALTFAQKEFQPDTIIDLATLTGAIIISLGSEYAGMFTNSDTLAGRLTEAGTKAGDPLWRFPLGQPYDKLIDSPIADMKNVGPRGGGSITAAQFLKRFIDKDVAWAHLDIAGMVWADKPGATWEKGATGFGVRLLDQLVADHYEA